MLFVYFQEQMVRTDNHLNQHRPLSTQSGYEKKQTNSNCWRRRNQRKAWANWSWERKHGKCLRHGKKDFLYCVFLRLPQVHLSDPVNCIFPVQIVFLKYESRAKREVSWADRGSIRGGGSTTMARRVLKESESLLSLPDLYFLFQLKPSKAKGSFHFHHTCTFTFIQIKLSTQAQQNSSPASLSCSPFESGREHRELRGIWYLWVLEARGSCW